MQILQPTTKQKGLKCCWNKLRMYMAIKAMKIWFSEDISVCSTANYQNEYLQKKKLLQQTHYGLWIHFKDSKRLAALYRRGSNCYYRRGSNCWWQPLLRNAEETSLCNKEIVWWTKVHYSTHWPPNSCDHKPLDYEIWDMMEKMVNKNVKWYEDIKGLSVAISDAWDRLKKNQLQSKSMTSGKHD